MRHPISILSRTSTHCLIALLSLLCGSTSLHAQTKKPLPVQFGPNLELSGGLPSSLGHLEPAIAGNPTDPKSLVAGYFGRTSPKSNVPCFFSSTVDGGLTWASGGTTPLGSSRDDCFDPSLTADAGGTFYFAYLDANVDSQGLITTSDVRVARSTDGGRSFPDSSLAVVGGIALDQPAPDKSYIAADAQTKSPFRGTLYLSYTDFVDLGQGLVFVIRVVVSRDGGLSWSSPVAISRSVFDFDSEGVTDSLPVVAPDGTAYVFYEDYNTSTELTAIKYVQSRDGGRSWSQPADVAANLHSPGGFFYLDNGDPKFGTTSVSGIFAASYPTAAAAPDGTLYVAWTDFPNGSCVPAAFGRSACRNADVRLAVSRDGGRNWSAPIKVSDDATSTDQFFPWIAADPDGLLSLIWLDKRLDIKNVNYDVFYTNTWDGRTFLPNVRVSTATSKVDSTYDGGDYNNLAVTSEGIFPIWNDSRLNSVQIFTARGTLAP